MVCFFRRCHDITSTAEDGHVYKCTECELGSNIWSKLAQHMWRKHKIDMELYKCPQCNFRSFTRKRLSVHRVTHSDVRPFLCDDCGKAFKNDKNLRLHKKLHEPEPEAKGSDPSLNCPVCHRGFKSAKLLKHHVNSVHGKSKPHLCNYCGYSGKKTITSLPSVSIF